MIEAVGRAVSIETETIIAIWILSRRSSRLYKGKLIKMETKMDREGSLQNWNVYSPQRQNNLIFFWLPYTVALARLLLESTPGEQCSETLLRSSPTLQTLQTLPPPTIRLCSLRSAGLSSGSDQRRIRGCGTRWLLAGPDSLPLWLCHVCAFVLLRCFSCSHTVLPKEHSLGIIFFLLTFLMFMLYFSSILLAFHY